MPGQYGVRHFRVDGTRALDETLTPNPGVNWRVLSVKLHVVATPTVAENFVIQVKDSTSDRYNVVLLREGMNDNPDVLQHYEGFGGLTLEIGQVVDFDWTNSESNGWGLTVAYAED